jgi:hypothetical protein
MGSKVAEARERPSCPAITTVFGVQEAVPLAWSTANRGGPPGAPGGPPPTAGEAVTAIDDGGQVGLVLGVGEAVGVGLADDATDGDGLGDATDGDGLGDAVTATEAEPHEVTRMARSTTVDRIPI